MSVSGVNYLHDCFEGFQSLCEKKYGSRFDLPAIERSVAHLRSHRPLTYDELRQFESPEHWWFEKFWVFPPEHHVTAALKRRKFNFWQLPANEKDVIATLLDVFKSIELVSIILRFIRPEHYGIISAPVERVLDVRRGSDAVETYLNYLQDLRAVRQNYGFDRASDADMALWVLHERCFGDHRDPAIEKEYAGDRFLLRLRTKNLVAHLVGSYSYTMLAESLFDVHLELAAQMGGIAFERMVRQFGSKLAHDTLDEQDLKSLIDQLHNQGIIDSLTHGLWQAHRKTRNKAIHGVTPPTRKEVELLIQSLKEASNKPSWKKPLHEKTA